MHFTPCSAPTSPVRSAALPDDLFDHGLSLSSYTDVHPLYDDGRHPNVLRARAADSSDVILKRFAITNDCSADPFAMLRLFQSLRHPGIVPLVTAFEDGSYGYMVYPYYARTLADVSTMPAGRVLEVARALLSALSVAHASGVQHNDIKQSHVFLDNHGNAVLGGFSVSQPTGPLPPSESPESDFLCPQSPSFFPPERLLRRNRGYSLGAPSSPLSPYAASPSTFRSDASAADVYTLGATLRSVLDPREQGSGLHTELDKLISWMMNVDPTARPSIVEIMQNPLFMREI